jgi:hypothetical protein
MKQDVVNELKSVLPELKTIVDRECEPVKDIDVVAAIKARIDGLEYQDTLLALLEMLRLKMNSRTDSRQISCTMTQCPQMYCFVFTLKKLTRLYNNVPMIVQRSIALLGKHY